MMDPIGLLALGITVSQGFLTAVASWKSFDEDISAAVEQIEDLNTTLTILSSNLTAFPYQGCKDGIATLRTALSKLQGCASENGQSSESRRRLQQLLFPLKQGGFKALRDVVTDLQQRLSLALQAYHAIGIGNVASEVKTSAENSGMSLAKLQDTVDRMVDPLNEASLSASLMRVGSELRTGTERTERSFAKLQESVDKIADSSESVVATTLLSRIEANTALVPQQIEDAMIQRLDSLERQIIARIDKAQSSINGLRNACSLDRDMNQAMLTLMSKPQLHKSVLDQAFAGTQECSRHHSDRETFPCSTCSRQRMPRKARNRDNASSSSFSALLYIPWARRSILLSMNINFGAGGQGIGAGLTLRGRVCKDSPAFKLVDEQWYKARPTSNDAQLENIGNISQNLQRLIVGGQASACDVDLNGDSLMHAVLDWIIFNIFMYNCDEYVVESCIKLVEMLVELGVPMNDINKERSPLSRVAWGLDLGENNITRFWWSISQMGFEAVGPTMVGRFWLSAFDFVTTLTYDESIAVEGARCGDLSIAVLRRSECELLRASKHNPKSVNERNLLDQTPLHLAVWWPEGFRLLIDAGTDYNAADDRGRTVLSYACLAECLETVQYLLEKQAAFVGHSFDEDGEEESYFNTIELLGSVSNQQIVDLVFSAFVDRRKRLVQMARTFVANEQLDQLVPTNGHILDVNVGDVCELLAARVSIPEYLHTELYGGMTVFHLAGNDTVLATKFWNLGFRDVDGYDAYGKTALMEIFDLQLARCVLRLEQALWLTTKGASMLKKEQNGRSWLASHYFAHGLGLSLRNDIPVIHRNNIENLVKQLRTEGDLDAAMLVEDICICRCSVSGCVAHTVFARRLNFIWSGRPPKVVNIERLSNEAEWWIGISCHLHQKPPCDIFKHIFRAIIFDLLELKHTCCDEPWGWHDWSDEEKEDERQEIHAEQAETYVLLETLIDLALSQWESETRSFSEFMKEFVEIQIKSKEEPPTKEYVEQLETIGVRMEKVKE